MTLDLRLVALLVCPVDKGSLYVVGTGDDTFLYNPRLQRRYRVNAGIPDLLPDEADEVGDAEHAGIMATIEATAAPLTGGGTPA